MIQHRIRAPNRPVLHAHIMKRVNFNQVAKRSLPQPFEEGIVNDFLGGTRKRRHRRTRKSKYRL
jgi:hypothetical protein